MGFHVGGDTASFVFSPTHQNNDDSAAYILNVKSAWETPSEKQRRRPQYFSMSSTHGETRADSKGAVIPSESYIFGRQTGATHVK